MPKRFVIETRETIWTRYFIESDETATPETIEAMIFDDINILSNGKQFFSEDFEITDITEA